MGMRTWLTSLATFGLTVSGITKSFDLDAIPDKITRGQLPCLIPIPEIGDEQGLMLLTFMGNGPQDSFNVTHRLLYAETANLRIEQVLPGLITIRDAYIAAAIAQHFLNYQASPVAQVVLQFSIQVGVGTWGDVEYHTIDFRHKVTLNL